MRRVLSALLVVASIAIDTAACKKADKPAVRVAAAADLAFAFEQLGAEFVRQTGKRVTFSFGSTGLLQQQLSQGAPFDLFAAADVTFADAAVRAGACEAASKSLYARGQLVVWTREGGPAHPATLAELALPAYARVAIANPDHAPYGRAAKEALQRAGAWEAVARKIVYGENVRQTLQYAQTGNVEAAVVALSLAVATKGGTVLPIDPALHAPIDQALVVCTRGADPEGGRAFAALVNSAEGRAVMRRFGFLLPGEQR